jgi:glycine cleavage system H protein
VLEINPKLDDAPELVNKDPFGDGWIIKVTVNDAEELSGLMSAEEYKAFVGK